jgi:Methylamine utilisation protein MauE
LRAVLGLLLLTAAALKLYGFHVSAVPRAGWLSTPWAQMALILWEVILGLWLVSGLYPAGSWLAALATFTVFAIVSGYLGWIGVASCGCFGSIKASPWDAFAVDVVALIALVVARPDLGSLREKSQRTLAHVGGVAVGAAALFGLLAGTGALIFGSADAALAHLRGERVSVRPAFVDIGSGVPGQTFEATVELVNRTDRPVRIIGGTSDCSCVTTDELPLTLGPGEARGVTVRVKLSSDLGIFNRKAFFWTDHDQARAVLFDLTGRIDPPAPVSVGASRE